MAKVIDGRRLAEKIKDQVVKDVIRLGKTAGAPLKESLIGLRRPNLAIILVGDREDSRLYVELKEREAKKVGIDVHTYRCASDISEADLIETVSYLNNDELIDAILVQLPLPPGLDADKVIGALDPDKDVDRFHPDNVSILLSTCDHARVMPPVVEVVLEILDSIAYDISGKRACVIANWEVFGRGVAKALECRGGRCEVASIGDPALKAKTVRADILVTAVGKKHYLKKDMVKKDAVVIDVGITKEDKKVYGDVDFEGVKDVVGWITPVPGGVGPLTIAMLFKNTVELYKRRREV